MIPNEAKLQQLKKQYPEGTRIRLLHMNDLHAVPQGTLGTVYDVDDTGSLLVRWDNGQGLNVLYGIDQVEIVAGNLEKAEEEKMSRQMNTIYRLVDGMLIESAEIGKQLKRILEDKTKPKWDKKESEQLIQTLEESISSLKRSCELLQSQSKKGAS